MNSILARYSKLADTRVVQRGRDAARALGSVHTPAMTSMVPCQYRDIGDTLR